VPQLCDQLVQLGCEVKVISTKSGLYFFSQGQLPEGVGPIAGDEDEWHDWKAVGDPVLHIELRRWADVYVVAPLSANSLAKLATGLCDNLVTCVARAWDFKRPMLVRTQQCWGCGLQAVCAKEGGLTLAASGCAQAAPAAAD
jgi:phosphopantothenoylcysteine decarboxylase